MGESGREDGAHPQHDEQGSGKSELRRSLAAVVDEVRWGLVADSPRQVVAWLLCATLAGVGSVSAFLGGAWVVAGLAAVAAVLMTGPPLVGLWRAKRTARRHAHSVWEESVRAKLEREIEALKMTIEAKDDELQAQAVQLEIAREAADDAEQLSRLTIEVLSQRHVERVLRSIDPHHEMVRWLYDHAPRLLRLIFKPADNSKFGIGVFHRWSGTNLYDMTHNAGVPDVIAELMPTDAVDAFRSAEAKDSFEAFVDHHYPHAVTRRLPVTYEDHWLVIFVEPAAPEHPLRCEILNAMTTTIASWLILIHGEES